MAECDTCQENWLVEVCDLRNGRVRTVWDPLSMRFDIGLDVVTNGVVELATRAVSMRDIWPGLTSVYISRVNGIGASRTNPICEFAGIVTEVGISESGTTVVGLKSINWYLTRRTLRVTQAYHDMQQTEIGRRLVNRAQVNYLDQVGVIVGNGTIPLTGAADTSNITRTRVYHGYRRKNIGEAIDDLTQVIDGPDWEFAHTRSNNRWSTQMIFRDYVGVNRGTLIRSDIEAAAYSISSDIESLANLADAYGAGEGEDQLMETAREVQSIYPEFDATPTWNDVSIEATLNSHAEGYVSANNHPDTRPTVTLPGLDLDPTLVRIGDTVDVDISYGAIRFNGKARVLTIAWVLSGDSPEMRTLELWPEDPTFFNLQPDSLDCEEC